MAIQFARVERVGRSGGKNACCKGAYNARTKVNDQRTGVIYDFSKKVDNVYHKILLPEYVNEKFSRVSEIMNLVETAERKKNSQLLKEYVLALPDEKNISLKIKQEMVHEFVKQNKWIEEGLGVQVDIHSPHDGEKNWHAHILVTTRRFLDTGLCFEMSKARDLDPQIRTGDSFSYVRKDSILNLGQLWANIQNSIFDKYGFDNRVDVISLKPKEHVGPTRMRHVINEAVLRNEIREKAETKSLSSGKQLLQKVTSSLSVFEKNDLLRATKIVEDSILRERLLKEALSDKSIIKLYRKDGSASPYFTTKQVRSEENKILRLAGYIANNKNIFSSSGALQQIDQIKPDPDNQAELTQEQTQALHELVTSGSALNILLGRAGTGKSHVLKALANIATANGINTLGIAPTHKAKLALSGEGFGHVDTIKGLLFKLMSNNFNLPVGSLVILDEAGMVGNDDYTELLRIVAARKCTIILSGDERQLSAVQRGGMFEVLANKYSSSKILNIQRQKNDWGREVAQAVSKGQVQTAIFILDKMDRIKWSQDAFHSMQKLLTDWSKSSYQLDDKLIIALCNKDVMALNHGAREYLKCAGRLTGDEFLVAGNHYMCGDRILVTKTNRKLGLVNGDLAEITYASEEKFSVRLLSDSQSNRVISFDPSQYSGFRHGYATTIFKAQGASIKEVYIYYSGFADLRNIYVALSRHIMDLHLYVDKQKTQDIMRLIEQLSYHTQCSSSISFFTKEELEEQKLNDSFAASNKFVRGLGYFIGSIENKIVKIADKYLPTYGYYNYVDRPQLAIKVEKVINQTYDDTIKHAPEKHSTETNLSFANKAHNAKAHNEPTFLTADHNHFGVGTYKSKLNYDQVRNKLQEEQQYLRSEVKFYAEKIANDLLGEPNKRLSSRSNLRFGKNGSVVVRIMGEKSGIWYDFSKGVGGDIFDLVREVKGEKFSDIVSYLQGKVGMTATNYQNANLRLVNEHHERDKLVKARALQSAEMRYKKNQALQLNRLYKNSVEPDKDSPIYKYLTKIRGIDIGTKLSSDIKMCNVYVKEYGGLLPSLVAFARDKHGEVTGGQQIFLDAATAEKAKLSLVKKSFGQISGSFVDLGQIGQVRDTNPSVYKKITIIAEGIETGLSIKEALAKNLIDNSGYKVRVLCALGIYNIKNYPVSKDEQIVVAADNDGNNSATIKTVNIAKHNLEHQGGIVQVIKPDMIGDYNDVLVQQGSDHIVRQFLGVIERHHAKMQHAEKLPESLSNKVLYKDQNNNKLGKSLTISSFKAELKELEALNWKCNHEQLAAQFANFSASQRTQYVSAMLAKAAKKHLEPLLKQAEHDRLHSNNFNQFLKSVMKEQKLYKKIYQSNPLAIRALDQYNGNLRFTNMARSIVKLSKKTSIKQVVDTLRHAAFTGLVDKQHIIKNINKNNGCLTHMYHSVKNKHHDYHLG